MIITHRPITIFDVDLVGAGSLLVLILGGCFAIGAPAMHNHAECRQIRADILKSQSEIARLETARRQMEMSLPRYRESLSRRAARIPLVEGLSPYLARIASCADESGIEIMQLQPGPLQKSADGVQSDIRVTARGSFRGFAHFLDRIRRENDCQQIVDLAIGGGGAPEGACSLTWTVRLNMLEQPITLGLAAATPTPGER